MNTRLFADLFTILMLAALVGRGAYNLGFWFGWVMDPEQWPRVMTALLIDLFRWDRQMSRAINDLEAWAEEMMADVRRAPRGTP